ncbi:MAG: hypothetical protein AB7G80_05065 [Dongiaceae bacterium]
MISFSVKKAGWIIASAGSFFGLAVLIIFLLGLVKPDPERLSIAGDWIEMASWLWLSSMAMIFCGMFFLMILYNLVIYVRYEQIREQWQKKFVAMFFGKSRETVKYIWVIGGIVFWLLIPFITVMANIERVY